MSTTPFLGCKISLISKSEIRYEGILYTIDPKESTIALAKVRSYGTEDRPADRQVPPREEIFEYIIFRANDIKDLIVDDPPASMAPGLADPAIIQAHSTSTSSAATFPSTSFPQMTTAVGGTGQRPAVQPFSNSALDNLSANITASKASASVDSRSRNSTPTNASQPRQSPMDKPNAWNVDNKHTPHKENQRRNTAERGGQHFRGLGRGAGGGPPQGYQNHPQNRRGSGPNVRGHQGHGQPHMPADGQRYNRPQNYNNAYNRPFNYSGRRPQSRPQQQRGSQNHRISTRPPKEPLKFDEDYDFDKAYEEFKGIEEKMSNLKLGNEGQSGDEKVVDGEKNEAKVADATTNGEDKEAVEPDQFYNKTKSFFDNISCEALEREKGNVQRIDWKAERKLNSETFGVPLSYRRFGYNRGRGGYNNRGYHGYRRNFNSGFNRGGGGGDGRRFAQPAARGRN